MELIFARDNHGKNQYFYVYDINKERKLGMAPWDLDATFGRSWEGSKTMSELAFVDFMQAHGSGEHHLYRRLRESDEIEYNSLLKSRYDELRFSLFSEQSLIERFSHYFNLFQKSGAALREENRWHGVSGVTVKLTEEKQYIENWIIERIAFLNEQYGEAQVPPPVNIQNVNRENWQIYPNPVVETLFVSQVSPDLPIRVFTETGICVFNGKTPGSSFTIDFTPFGPGRYYVMIGNQGKLIIKNK